MHRVPDLRDADGRGGQPRNTLIGDGVGILAAALSLALFGLLDEAGAFEQGVTFLRVLAVAVGVLLLTPAGWLLNRAPGVPAPTWAAPR